MEGWIYVLHFDRPLHHARHYVGWTTNVDRRLAFHRRRSNARIMRALQDAGIGFILAAAWPGTRTDERRIHRQHHSARYCPICSDLVPF